MPASRVGARRESPLLGAAALSFAAGATHAAAAAGHDADGWGVALFAVAAAGQVAWALWAVQGRSSALALAGVVMQLTLVGVWVASRTTGLPFPEVWHEPQPVGRQDGAAALLAAGAAIEAVRALLARQSRSTDPAASRPRFTRGVGLVVGAATALGTLGVTASHHHVQTVVSAAVPVNQAGTSADRLPAGEAAALLTLSARAVTTTDGGTHHRSEGHGSGGHGSGYEAPPPPLALSEPDAVAFRDQWAAATAAATRLATVDAAEAAGYVQSATVTPGIGAHYVKWSLVDRPFDPGSPSMLLFDTITAGRSPQLVGLSYWVASPDRPEGFAGPNDDWHSHQGLCFVNGWLRDEGVAHREECRDTWIAGTDLWMLHVWSVPGLENPWGPFAAVNPNLCRRAIQVPDALTCDPMGR